MKSQILHSFLFFAISIGILNILAPLREVSYLTLAILISLLFLRAVLPKRFKNRTITFLWNFSVIFLMGSVIYHYNEHLAYSYFAGAGVVAAFYAFSDKLSYYAPQIAYFWVGLAIGFVLSLTVFIDEARDNTGLFLLLTFGLGLAMLLIGKLVNYRLFSKRLGTENIE
ncbi:MULTISPECIES: hypothetical protein [Thermococcus]|uniref:Uncharacterized protein n=1 Tax=Thermococcus nautili TaxID=195522 RepID=W8NV57_9EURY|nr:MULTISPECIES: hypothetical protein [Thermococcus]AHL23062.1 hypothetical protein BD01_1451 [Thermococcus nautili]NJE49443.1 hypothetical protein [Thermococcus sp. 9N3]